MAEEMRGPVRSQRNGNLLKGNPMMAEVRMANARFIGGRNWSASQIAAASICGMLYLFFLAMVVRSSETIEASFLFFGMLGMMLLVLPIVLHGVIAGEREKRSLEMLLAAPVTSTQIAVAKLFRAGLFAAVVAVAFLLPIITVLIVQAVKGQLQGFQSPGSAFLLCLTAMVVIAFAAIANAAISLAISAAAKSTSASMIANVGIHFFLLGFAPVLLAPIWSFAPDTAGVIACVHPFWAIMTFLPLVGQTSPSVPPITGVLVGIPIWSFITLICFRYIVSSLDHERRLGGRRKSAKES